MTDDTKDMAYCFIVVQDCEDCNQYQYCKKEYFENVEERGDKEMFEDLKKILEVFTKKYREETSYRNFMEECMREGKFNTDENLYKDKYEFDVQIKSEVFGDANSD